jgi:cereblon
MAEPY